MTRLQWRDRAGFKPASLSTPADRGLTAEAPFLLRGHYHIVGVWYAGGVRSSVSIALFFLLSAFFLTALLGALGKDRRWLGGAGVCLVALACIIVFLKPVQLPSKDQLLHGASTTTSSTVPPGPPGAAGAVGTPVVDTTVVRPGATTTTTSPSQG
jgi:hypothetical protein